MAMLPGPPTDNLYKFMAIFGLALIIASFVGAYKAEAEIQSRFGARIRERELLMLEQRREAALGPAYEHRDWRIILDSFAVEARADTLANEGLLAVKTRFDVLLWVGAGMSLAGFLLWYTRLQRFEDALVKRKASESTEADSSLPGDPDA
jgi:hypothetical protein